MFRPLLIVTGLVGGWIAGIPLPVRADPTSSQPDTQPQPGDAQQDHEDWWAFQPLAMPAIPQLEGDDWSRTPVDAFVLRRLRTGGFRPAPLARRITRIRRLYYNLIGLPPTPDEMEAFLHDEREYAWEALVDRLLADPRYGEHAARHWLDVVRYSESDGWKQDAYREHIWQYRDFVVWAFNQDIPYDQFVRMQLAGDELPGDEPQNLVATGFLRLGIYEYNQRDARNHWNDVINELTDVTADVFLGVSLSCARCHDHKFDPIPQRDYFGLRAFFEPLAWQDNLQAATPAEQAAYRAQLAVWNEATHEIRARCEALLDPYRQRKWKATVEKFPLEIQACYYKPDAERNTWEKQMAYLVERQFYEEGNSPLQSMQREDRSAYDALQANLAQFDHLKPEPLPTAMAASDFLGSISPTRIPETEENVLPAFLTALRTDPDDAPVINPTSQTTGRRTALAEWIGDPRNPLSTRVIVNRIWQQHFGRGIVSSASDFGRMGQPPSHPELLDWLAADLGQRGWHCKSLHRQLVTSATWQQAAQHDLADRYEALDPAGSLLWRSRVRRLSAEQIRDSMFAASDNLDLQVGGPSRAGDAPRRALYLKSFRNSPHDFLHAFDMANGLKSVAARPTTTTPLQSLMMFNGSFVLERAKQLAAHLEPLSQGNFRHKLRQAFFIIWGRTPNEIEWQATLAYFQDTTQPITSQTLRERLTDICHVLLNSNEFLYVD